jgi:hypothetical protein
LTLIDGLGFYPTFRKSFYAPFEENVSWTFRATAVFVFSVLATKNYSWTTVLYPGVMIMVHTALGVMLLWRRRVMRHG